MSLTFDNYRNEQHRVVGIGYLDGHPFSVLTEKVSVINGKTGKTPYWWDFDYCKRDDTVYFHMSGAGGDMQWTEAPFCEPTPPKAELWLDPVVSLVNGKGKQISERQLLKMGTVRIPEPRQLKDWGDRTTQNPFDIGIDGETVYCKVCDDRLPEDRECEHLEWCDDCGDHFYVKGRELVNGMGDTTCKHEEPEEDS